MPIDVARSADVPDLSHEPARGGVAAGEGEPRARPARRPTCPATRCCRTCAKKSPTCASTATCAGSNARPTSTFPKLMLEAKAAYVSTNGLHAARLAADADRHAGRASPAGCPASRTGRSRNPQARWLLEKVDRHRPRPQAAAARPPQLPAAIRAAAAAPSAAHERRKDRVLRRHVRQPFRHATRRSARRRAAAQRRRRLRAARISCKPACR